MTHKYVYPSFYFNPVKLRSSVKRLREKYKHGIHLPPSLITKRLPNLLEKIRLLPNNEKVIIKFANNITSIDLNILISVYPYNSESEETTSKIMQILSYRYNSLIGRRFWDHFQHRTKDKNINQILSTAFKVEDDSFLGLSNRVRKEYQKIFEHSSPGEVLEALAINIGNEKDKITNTFSKYHIEEDSLLANELWIRILELFIANPNFIAQQDLKDIIRRLSHLHLQQYKEIIVTYLARFKYSNYNELLLKQVVERLKDPRVDSRYWTDISDHIIKKVKAYLNEIELSTFFDQETDNERFNYWRRYIRFIEDLETINTPSIVAMFFQDFVVVEFGNVGNAAYFYEREGFSNYLAHKMKHGIRENELKNRYVDYYINKLNHSGYWQETYDKYMENYLNGFFDYSHRR